MLLVPLGAFVVAFALGLMPFVPELVKQISWLVAIAVLAAWAWWDWRRRERDKRERAEQHRQRMAERGTDVPPRLRKKRDAGSGGDTEPSASPE